MKKILIAEDDFYILDIYKSTFAESGYTVDTAKDGEEALAKLKASTYDVLLLDIMLPKVSGTEIINWCRTDNSPAKNLLIYALTNLDESVFIKKVIAEGANGYFVKSDMTPDTLLEKVNAGLRVQNKI
jgi:DNA-binding response OmpR family regulator